MPEYEIKLKVTMQPTVGSVPETGLANLNTKLTRTTTSSTINTDDIKPDSKKLKMEVFVPTMEFLRHERRIKQEDYKKLDKMKNVSLLCYSAINIRSLAPVFSPR